MNICGRRIRLVRLARRPRMSQSALIHELARRGITLDRTSLSRVENQERGVPDYELKAFAQIFGTTMEWLCGKRAAKTAQFGKPDQRKKGRSV